MPFVYLINIQNTNQYKIGYSKNHPLRRLNQLQTASPIKLSLLTYFESPIAIKIEKTLHRHFQANKFIVDDFMNLKGEWFILNHDEELNFNVVCKRIEDNILLTTQIS